MDEISLTFGVEQDWLFVGAGALALLALWYLYKRW